MTAALAVAALTVAGVATNTAELLAAAFLLAPFAAWKAGRSMGHRDTGAGLPQLYVNRRIRGRAT